MLQSLYVLGSLLLYVNFGFAQADGKHMCLDRNFDSFLSNDLQKHSWVPCQQKRSETSLAYLRFPSFYKSSSAFDISFQCFHVPDVVCQKAKRAFEHAGDMISQVILFKEPVRVNATLMSFCKVNQECDKGMMILGGSSPARAIPLFNDDGLMRLHPQALVKQFGLSDHPAFAPFDILSVFNADAPFWFEEDGVPIQQDQADFSFVVLHEFMHGLGFYSGWNEYISKGALTPDPSPFLANQFISMVNPMSTALHSTQFLESAMDRMMWIAPRDSKQLSSSELTRQLNRIQANSLDQLVMSPEFKPATEMAFFATYPKSLGLKVSSTSDPIILETGLNPFQPGSSISHVDYETYTKTPDFLMRFMQDRGVTLQDAIRRGGGTGPIGPLLINVLEEIGYSTKNKPDNSPHLLLSRKEKKNHSNESSSNSIKIYSYLLTIPLCILFINQL